MDTRERVNGLVLSSVSNLPPEIWGMVGELIQSQKTLRALVQVCRAFRDIFTHVLYSHCQLHLELLDPKTPLDQKALPPGLTYTKALDVFAFEFSSSNPYNRANNNSYASFVTRIVNAAPNLLSFRWLDSSFEDFYQPSLILRNPGLLQTLKKAKNLQNISIQFASQNLEDRVAAHNCFVRLEGFQNLRSLELYNFYGDEKRLTNDIAGALGNSPNLKTLGLGMACDCDCDCLPEAIILEDECDFLKNICIQYESQSTRPLALETLRLGHGMCLFVPGPPSVDNFLAKLVKTDGLKQLNLFNGHIKYGSIEEDEEIMEIDLSLLRDCKSLHQLSVSRLEKDVRKFLNKGGNSVQELIVTDHYSLYDGEMEEWDALNLPNLSMLFTRERTVRKRNTEEDWSDIDSSDTEVSDVDLSDMDSSDLESPDSDSLDSDMGSSDMESSESDSSDSDMATSDSGSSLPERNRSAMTVLDRLHDHGAHLSRLGLCLDFERQWEQFSLHVSNMSRLTQLRLNSKSWRSSQYPTNQSSLWPDVQKPKDIAVRYAELLKTKCPSLQYIQIHHWAWQFIVQRGAMSTQENIFRVDLLELDQDEMLAIELFAFENFAQTCGLPGPEDPEGISEEDHTRLDEYAEQAEEQMRGGIPPEEYYA